MSYSLFSTPVARRVALVRAALLVAVPAGYASTAQCRTAHAALESGTLGARLVAYAVLDADLRAIAADEAFWQANASECAAAQADEERAARIRACVDETSRWY